MTAAEWIKEQEEMEQMESEWINSINDSNLAIEIERSDSFVCPKCGGSGHLREYQHIAGGLCFYCNGRGTNPHYKGSELKQKQILSKLPELTKKQTWYVALFCLVYGTEWIYEQPNSDLEKLVSLGYAVKTLSAKRITYKASDKTDHIKLNWL